MLDIYVESRLCEGELGFLSVLPGVEGVAGFFFLLIVKSEERGKKRCQNWYFRNCQPTQIANSAEMRPFAGREACPEEKSGEVPGPSPARA